MATKIKAVGKQVKKAAQEERRQAAKKARVAHLPVEAREDEERDEVAIVNTRAMELRGIARRLRTEAMLVDVAASVEEARGRELAQAMPHKLSAPREMAGGVTAH